MIEPARIVVAIPAKDEAELLPLCLTALGKQTGVRASDIAIVVACNNCSDDTANQARSISARLPFRTYVEEVTLASPIAHAGGARRRAMDLAAERCTHDGLILTTDADGVPDHDWIAALDAAFHNGADAVAGRVSTDWEQLQKFPAPVLDIGAREWEYQGLSAELDALCDPETHDPWPRHNQTCGANAAIRRTWYDRIGGLPVLRTGEDGAMFQEVWRHDGRIRHDMRAHVTVSARLVGRAQGGMADALSLRHGDSYLCDDLLEPAEDLARRSKWRRAARQAFHSGHFQEWAASVDIKPELMRSAAVERCFGEAWLNLESVIPELEKRRITASSLDGELAKIKAELIQAKRRAYTPEMVS